MLATGALGLTPVSELAAKDVAYIHGDVSASGQIPSGGAAPFHQMLLTDSGALGCSQFRQTVTDEGYTITQHYDQGIILDSAFLSQFDVLVFGLHQKVWSSSERAALHTWLLAGGGIMMFSDSAAGGNHSQVGIGNNVGQSAVNSILSRYGMEVTVDQGLGTRSYTSPGDASHPVVSDQPVFEGEGVSPIAVDESRGARALIPFEEAFKISGGNTAVNNTQGITIQNPRWATVAHQSVGTGNIIAIFDRQPFWNNGPGSDINRRDNKESLRRIVRFLANDYRYPQHWLNLTFGTDRAPLEHDSLWGWHADVDKDGLTTLQELAFNGNPFTNDRNLGSQLILDSALDITFRQWSGGAGITGLNYRARGILYRVEYSPNLQPGSWSTGPTILEVAGDPIANGDGTESVTVRVLPPIQNFAQGFVRLCLVLEDAADPLIVEAGDDRFISAAGSAFLNGSVAGPNIVSTSWRKISGTGSVTYDDPTSAQTSANFSAAGTYQLAFGASNGLIQFEDTMTVQVIDSSDVVEAINCGSTSSYSGNDGFSYQADRFFSGGHTDQFPGNAVANTADDLLYNFARSAHSAYRIPVPPGDYTVLLKFSETFFTAENQRVFDASLEGVQVLDDLDLVHSAPGKWVAYDRAFETSIDDGALTLEFSSSINNALLNGIVVLRR